MVMEDGNGSPDLEQKAGRTEVRVEVMGQSYSVVSEDGPVHVKEVAAFVDQRMSSLAGHGRTVAPETVAVMTALNIASEYQKLSKRHADLEEAIERLTARLSVGMSK